MKKNDLNTLTKLPKSVIQHIEHLERIREDFVANVSHELRTPLTVIRGYLETLIDESGQHPWNKIFHQMYQHSLRMENIIEDLLLLSHLEHHDLEKAHQSVNVANLINNIVIDAKQVSADKQHNISLNVDKNLYLFGNIDELKSLFSNIILNAVKYTPAKGEIKISWYKKDKHGYFSVADTGIGIAKKHIPRLTERFYRVDKARSRESGGTGLGLAIVKHVLIRHDGKLNIESEVNVGSQFTCIFPHTRLINS